MAIASAPFGMSIRRCLYCALSVAVVFIAGCSANGNITAPTGTAPVAGASTAVTVLLSSTANDQLTQFHMNITGITLTNKAGNTVTVLSTPVFVEAMHANGNSEPLATVSIPQDVYTSAAITVTGADLTYVDLVKGTPGSLYFVSDNWTSASPPTVNLPSSIVVSGTGMGLLMDFQVPQSAAFSGTSANTFPLTPTFNLTKIALSSAPTSDRNGQETNIYGRVASVNAGSGSFSLTTTDKAALTVQSNSSTVFQGITGFSSVAVGTFLNMDAAIQPDGSLLATRIEVADTGAKDVVVGPLIQAYNSTGNLDMVGRQQQGDDFASQSVGGGMLFRFTSSTVFRISGGFSNLQGLPFAAAFNGSNITIGQNVALSTVSAAPSYPYPAATTITLSPQTINGSVSAVSSSGGYDMYTVTLSPNDVISNVAGINRVTMYVNSSTRMLTSAPIAAGSTVRFNGLLFNDNGTLRMVCGQVNDGVAM